MSKFVPWTTQSGYPVVMIKSNYDRNQFKISQKKFLLKGKSDNTFWNIPISYASSKENSDFINGTFKFSISGNEEHQMVLPERVDWIVFNVQRIGDKIISLQYLYFLNAIYKHQVSIE